MRPKTASRVVLECLFKAHPAAPMPKESDTESLDHLMFRHLVTEFNGDSPSEADRAIKRGMKAKGLGKLDVLALERKNLLQKEIGLFAKSRYYLPTLDQPGALRPGKNGERSERTFY